MFSTLKRKDTDPELLMTVATAEKELTVLLNSDLTTTKDSLKRTRLSQDPTEVFFAEDVLNQESLEPSYLRRSRPSKDPNKLQRNDLPII